VLRKNNIIGEILNNVSESMFDFYKEMIEERVGVKVLGFMPHIPGAVVESRHLGLVCAEEISDIKKKIGILREQAMKSIDLEMLLEIAGQRHAISLTVEPPPLRKENQGVKICIARDEAFSFWYEDNSDLFRSLGAEICYFSPLHDKELPDGADGLIIPGGYMELFPREIEKNESMRRNLKLAAEEGIPVYAEGGGFSYLQQSLTDMTGKQFKMAGVLSGHVRMTKKLRNFGYYEIEATRKNILCGKGGKINAHFFGYSASDREGDCFMATKKNGKVFPCIVAEGNILAGYQHLHFWGNSEFASEFRGACAGYRDRRKSK